MPREFRRATRRNRWLATGLWTLVGGAWATEIIADNLNASDHVLADIRVLTLAATIGVLNSLIVGRLDRNNELLHRAYEAMMDLRREQPDPTLTPRPWRGLRSVGADDEPALRNGHGGNRGSSGA